MLRGVAGTNIFADEKDKVRLCLILQAASEKHDFLIHAFCFMTNHLHFIIEPRKSPLHECVHAFAFRFAQYFNRRHKRQGYLFQGRFRSILIDDETYIKRLIRYIHLNPLEAFLVTSPEKYQWSSHRAYLEIDHYTWLTKDQILSRFAASRNEAKYHFAEYIQQENDVQIDSTEIITAFKKGIFGSEEFVKDSTPLCEKGKQEQSLKAITLDGALEHVCNKFQIDLELLCSQNKSKDLVDARSILALLARIGKQSWNLQDVAKLLNKNHGSISRLASRAKLDDDLCKYVHSLLSN